METKKESASVAEFENVIGNASPMPLYNNTKKEKSSYDYFNELGKELADSLASGKSPLLPGKDGFIDIQPAFNVKNNDKLEGMFQIMLLTKAAELNAPSNAFVTFDTVKKAQEAGVDCKVVKGSKGIVLPAVDESDWSKITFKNNWFNLSQIENADKLVEYCNSEMTKQYEKDVAFIKEKHPDSTYAEKKNPANRNMSKNNVKAMPLNEKTEQPFQYLAQVLNALHSNRKLHVTPQQAEQFKNKALSMLNAEIEPGKKDVLAIKKLTNSAQALYKKNLKYLEEKSAGQKKAAPEIKKNSPKIERKTPVMEYGRSM